MSFSFAWMADPGSARAATRFRAGQRLKPVVASSTARLKPSPTKIPKLHRRRSGLTHLAQGSAEIKGAGGLVIPAYVAVGDRPLGDFCGFGDRLTERGAGKAIAAFV